VAVREFAAPAAQPSVGKSMTDMLVTDLVQVKESCTLTIAA